MDAICYYKGKDPFCMYEVYLYGYDTETGLYDAFSVISAPDDEEADPYFSIDKIETVQEEVPPLEDDWHVILIKK